MGTRARKLLAATAAITMVLGAGGAAGAQDPDAGSIAEVATEDGRFTTLLTALDLAGLSEMFTDCDGGPYTVLAPTDDAFTATLEALQLEATDLIADQELLTSVLTYHVIDGAVASDAVAGLDGSSATTLNGEDIDIAVDGDSISIGSGNPTAANVVAADVQACNGIIHAIDAVLVPPTVASGLGLGQETATVLPMTVPPMTVPPTTVPPTTVLPMTVETTASSPPPVRAPTPSPSLPSRWSLVGSSSSRPDGGCALCARATGRRLRAPPSGGHGGGRPGRHQRAPILAGADRGDRAPLQEVEHVQR